MSAECQLESIHRIHVLRAELEKSLLRANGGSNESETISQQRTDEKRPLNVLFRSGEAAQIQISGYPRAAFAVNKLDPTFSGEHPAAHHQILAPSSPTSRFTVSPTPNAIPAMTDERKQRTNGETPKPRPLRVLITRQSGEEEENAGSAPIKSITVPTANLVTASSPASSIDSGVGGEVASPGIITNNNGNEFHLFGSPSSPSGFPSWATIPKAKRRIFNFFNTELSPVIDALALPTAKTDSQNGTPLKLQEPPSGKNHGFLFKSTPFLRENQQQNNEGNNGYSSSTASSTSTISPTPPSTNKDDNEPNKMPTPQRQNDQQRQEDQPPVNGLPPRAGTIPPLKSILKKPKPATEGAHPDLPRNHQRRMPTRIFLSRSISEVLPPPSSPSSFFGGSMADFNAAILGELTSSPSPPISHLDVFDEHLEQQCGEEFTAAQTKGNSSPSTCSTDTNENGEAGGSFVKKRVSFSEHVQARIYRSNSSILGQRRKNEKKSKQRSNRRCNSDEFEGGSSCEMDLGSEPGCKSSPPICRTREPPSVFSSHPANNSGFSVLAQ